MNRWPPVFALILLLLSAFAVDAGSVRPDCPWLTTTTRHFPKQTFEPADDFLDEFVREWYSKHLAAMREPPLWCGQAGAEVVYRFLWLRTFHNPIAIRVSRTAGAARLELVRLSGSGGYDPGKVARRKDRQLTEDEWTTIVTAIESIGFWAMPSHEPAIGFDGAQWILEARRGDEWHVVHRWSPQDGFYLELGLLLLRLAGIDLSREPIY
jgi:hypothetical protein